MKKTLLIGILLFTFTLISAQEKVILTFPENENWEILSESNNNEMFFQEYILAGEDGENWSKLVNITSFGSRDRAVDTLMNIMFLQVLKTAPESKLTFIDKKESSWILFTIESPGYIDDENYSESQLWYISIREKYIHICFIAVKKDKISKKIIKRWTPIFKSAEYQSEGE
ncbi:MAG: hypothetical protein JXR53_02980 [Bacteroidales bacterium]|nr:hypothetical protein [Bacteroidales bacterium]